MKTRVLHLFNSGIERLKSENTDLFLTIASGMILLMLCFTMSRIAGVLFFAGLLLTCIRTHRYYWTFLTLILAVPYWFLGLHSTVPNHAYLFVFAVLLVTLTLFVRHYRSDWETFFGLSAKWLIGLIFLFAVFGKIISPDFLSGSFFEAIYFLDERFAPFTELILNDNGTTATENKAEFLKLFYTENPQSAEILIQSDTILEKIALVMMVWTICIEAVIAVLFLLPNRLNVFKIREIALLLFVITTYPITTVSGFAMLLLILGYIQSAVLNGKTNSYTLLYLILFLLTPLLYLPYAKILGFILNVVL